MIMIPAQRGECNVRRENIFDPGQHHPLVYPCVFLCFVDASRVVVLELLFLDRAILRPLIQPWGPTGCLLP